MSFLKNIHSEKRKLWPVICLLLLVSLFLSGCKNANGEDETDQKEEEEVVTIPVEAATVGLRDIAAFYSGTASLEADQRASIVSQTTGVILEVLAEEGDYVESGQTLLRLETDRYQLEVERTEAELNRLSLDFNRKKELFDRSLISAENFEQVRANFEAQKAAHNLAKLDLRYTTIKAPFAGFISERLVRVGNLVSNLDPVFRITSYDPLLAVLHVPERELRVLNKGMEAEVTVAAWPGEVFTGVITRISPVVDAATGTFRVTAELRDEQGRLRPGLFGRVEIRYDEHKNVPSIPRGALISEDDQNHVFVVLSDNTVERREISIGYEKGGFVEVVTGLSDGETVVTAGKGSLNNGATVEVIGSEA